jgi:hypothetical protein
MFMKISQSFRLDGKMMYSQAEDSAMLNTDGLCRQWLVLLEME